ncbi:hypothetical protein [Gilvibacter sediminis]|uniref:hypothetical protein n=1 Tax=Gilvibacter sediminis TaxID=379071 RepID=UPI002350D65A|nr:hypothetical protein [Gilvibacter sediminis]MDC7998628.1 hypothetical protein [Gilvibacter sediminis]
MKTYSNYLVLLFLMAFTFGLAQEDQRFQYDSFSIQPLGLYKGQLNQEGLSGRVDLNFRTGKKRISLAVHAGSELNILSGSGEFLSFEGLYGYNFKPIPRVELDLQIGVSAIRFQSNGTDVFAGLNTFFVQAPKSAQVSNASLVDKYLLGVPLLVKIRIPTGPRFSLGLQGGYHFNKLVNFAHWGIVLQWNKRRE